MLEIIDLKREDFSKYTERIEMDSSDVLQPVQEIIDNVRKNKDKALHDYTLKFDKADITELRVPTETIEKSIENIDVKLKKALEDAAENVSKFHKAQIPSDWTMEVRPGVKAGQIIRPLKRKTKVRSLMKRNTSSKECLSVYSRNKFIPRVSRRFMISSRT